MSAEGDRMRQIMAFINTGFTGAFTPLWVALEMDPPRPALQASLREWGKEAVIARHDRLEEMVGDGPYLVGDRPTQIGRAHVCTPATNAHLVCRLLLETKNQKHRQTCTSRDKR